VRAHGTSPLTRCGIDTVEIARVERETGASAVAVAEPASS
jgi:hypothetical protein